MSTFTENWNALPDATKDLERARQSLVEELDAIDLYQQRIDSTKDGELKKVLAHNRDEEKEHVALLYEYIKAHDIEQAAALGKSNIH